MADDIDGQLGESSAGGGSILIPMLSALFPGVGDLWLGRRSPTLRLRGIAFLLLAIAFLALYTFGGMCHFYWAFWVARSWFVVNFCSAFLTYLSLFRRLHIGRLLLLLLVSALLGQGIVKGCVYLYGVRDYEVPSSASEPTILKGENIWCDESSHVRKNLRRGDVVTLNYRQVIYVKRLIAFGGDEVTSLDGHLQVNGKPLEIPFRLIDQESDETPRSFGPVHVPVGKVFVIGDNRDVSFDSRNLEFGYPSQSGLRGRVYFVRTSPDRNRVGVPVR
jgi:signal peptidase I